MVSASTWIRYIVNKIDYSISVAHKRYGHSQQFNASTLDTVFKNVFAGKLTFLHYNKGKEMAPTIGLGGGTLLVRKIPTADPMKVHVGDVVVVKDPEDSDKYIVRRLAAVEGHEMFSTIENNEPFVLEKGECWVIADNEDLKPKESYDSRTFGPVNMTNIVGRVMYCLRSAADHGPINNSNFSAEQDSSVLAMELDVDEMTKTQRD